jgi:hypothetical protein
MTKKLLSAGLVILLIAGLAFTARLYLQDMYPRNPSGSSSRFWRSGLTAGANMVSTVTVSDKDTLVRAGIFYSNVFDTRKGTEIQPGTGDVVQVPADEFLFFGTTIIGGQVQDSLLLTWYGHRGNGDSTTTAVAAQDTIIIDTVGVSDELDEIYFMIAFSPSVIYDRMSISLAHVRQVAGDTAFFDDCGIMMRWND